METGFSENRTASTALLTLISTKKATEKAEDAATVAVSVASTATRKASVTVKSIETATSIGLKNLRDVMSLSASVAAIANYADIKGLTEKGDST